MLFPTVLLAAALHCAGTADPHCPLFGDVDGDGRVDRVYVERMSGCRYGLVVRALSRTFRASIRPDCSKPSELTTGGFPRVVALRPMNAQPGLEPEVLMWSGASNDGVRFFTVFRDRLRPMRIRPEPWPPDEWNVGGFASAFSLTDCVTPHTVRRAARSWDLRRWHGLTETYRVTSTAFVRTASERLFYRIHGDDFDHCGGVERGSAFDP